MPVEIRELVIRGQVEHEDSQGIDPEDQDLAQRSVEDMEHMIQECVRQVLRILEKKKER
jgi:hypothetical protein